MRTKLPPRGAAHLIPLYHQLSVPLAALRSRLF